MRSPGPYPVCRNLRNNAIPLKEAYRAEGWTETGRTFIPSSCRRQVVIITGDNRATSAGMRREL